MPQNPTLEDFIKNYVQSKARSETAESYEDWVKYNGIDSDSEYGKAIRDISSDYNRAKSEYGSLAESLGELGLNASGYSDYLNGKAYSEMQKRKEGAREQYSENEFANKSAYAEYLKEIKKTQSENYESIVTSIRSEGILSYEDAYEYAVGRGLSEEEASLAAKTGSELARKKLRTETIKAVVTNGFTKKQARDYALALGLSDDEAEQIGEYAEKFGEGAYYSSDYLEYLKNKWASEDGSNNN